MDLTKYNKNGLSFQNTVIPRFGEKVHRLTISYDNLVLYSIYLDTDKECVEFIERNYKKLLSCAERISYEVFLKKQDEVEECADWLKYTLS